MKTRSLTTKWCSFVGLCLIVFTPVLALAQYPGYYGGYGTSCGGPNPSNAANYWPSIGGCSYSSIKVDD